MNEPTELLNMVSVLLVYLEIEFSQFKDTVDKYNQKKQLNVASIERINGKYIHKLVFQLQQLEAYFEMNPGWSMGELTESQSKCYNSILVRLSALALYASLNTLPGTLSTTYYVKRITSLLKAYGIDQVIVANSRVFPLISEASINELLKLYNKTLILKQADKIAEMFEALKYQEVIDVVEEFAEHHRLVSQQFSVANFYLCVFIFM